MRNSVFEQRVDRQVRRKSRILFMMHGFRAIVILPLKIAIKELKRLIFVRVIQKYG